jgi:hypothetical protein
LVRDGLYGGRDVFARQVKKLASRLAEADPDMAEALLAELGRDPALRSFQANPVDADSRLNLLQEIYPVVLPRDPVWSTTVAEALGRVVAEWQGATQLREAGLTPTRSVLLSGPSGVGKTLAAHWLAMQLNVPLLILDLATVMNSYLGKTGQNLRLVLNHALATRSVLLLDEFDAIAKRRDDDSDIGELKRLVNVLLQAVDNWSGESLLVAATNHPDLLDPAVWRRFDLALSIAVPETLMIRRFLSEHGVGDSDLSEVASLVEGESFAHQERWLRAAKKETLLHGTPFLSALVGAVARDRQEHATGKRGRDMKIWLLHQQGKSAREIGRELSISHPTVQSVIRRFQGESNGQK